MNPSGRGILTVTSCRETYEDRIIADIRLTQELLAGSILEFGTRENPRVPAAFAEWFGQYSLSRSATVQHNLGRIGRRLYLSGVSIMCGGCAEQLGYPVEFCKHTLQLWRRRSVTDRFLDQRRATSSKKSGSAEASGTSRNAAE